MDQSEHCIWTVRSAPPSSTRQFDHSHSEKSELRKLVYEHCSIFSSRIRLVGAVDDESFPEQQCSLSKRLFEQLVRESTVDVDWTVSLYDVSVGRYHHTYQSVNKLRLASMAVSIPEEPWGMEGPFICDKPGVVGYHDPDHVLQPSVEAMQNLFELADGNIRLVKIAAEIEGSEEICRFYIHHGIAVSLGHQMAGYSDLQRLSAAGAAAWAIACQLRFIDITMQSLMGLLLMI